MNKISGLKLVVLGALAYTGLTLAPSAQAQSFGPPCIISGGATYIYSQGCASEYTVNAQYTYLSTGQQTSIMGSVGAAEGVIELLKKLNDNIAKGNEGDRQNMPNQDLANRTAEANLAQREMIAPYARSITAEACRESTVHGGAGGGGGSRGTTASADLAVKDDIEPDTLTPKQEDNYLGDLVAGRATKYCTAADVANKFPQCAGEGALPGFNTNPTVLFREANRSGKLRSYSYKFEKGNEKYEAMIDYLRMASPFPGPALNDKAKETPDGRRFLTMQRRYNVRTLAVLHSFSRIAAESASLPADSYVVKEVWSKPEIRQDFEELYPGVQFPTAPSDREYTRLLVLREFGQRITTEYLTPKTVEEYAKAQLDLTRVNNLLLLKQKEEQEWTNVLLTHLLSNEVDPVTRNAVMSQAAAAGSSR